MKKICSLALAALLLLGSTVGLASCASMSDVDPSLDKYAAEELKVVLDGGELIFEELPGNAVRVVKYNATKLTGDVVVIPDFYKKGDDNEIPVQEIGKEAFHGLSSVVEVKLPAHLTTISEYAFADCTALTTISMANTETVTVGDYAFQGCVSLKNVNFGDKLESIGDYAFHNCKELAAVDFPNSLKTIGEAAFWNCASLKTLDTKNVESLGMLSFYNCTGLTLIQLRDALKEIGAFDGVENGKDELTRESVFVVDEKTYTSESGDYLLDLQSKIDKNAYLPGSVADQYVKLYIEGILESEEESRVDDPEETTEGEAESLPEVDGTTPAEDESAGEPEVDGTVAPEDETV